MAHTLEGGEEEDVAVNENMTTEHRDTEQDTERNGDVGSSAGAEAKTEEPVYIDETYDHY